MKRLLSIVAVLLAIALLGTLTVYAEGDTDDIYSVCTLESGAEITLADPPAPEAMGAVESYDVIVEEEVVLTVEHVDLVAALSDSSYVNGYYAVEFTLPDTTQDVFLTGLSGEHVDEIQSRIINSYAQGTDFDLTDLGFIDAEKRYETGDGDDNLCWAASSSNLLDYTGWGAVAGFGTTDDIFEDFISEFSDDGGHPYTAMGWFFNGVKNDNDPSAAAPQNYPNSGGYLRDYIYTDLCGIEYLDDTGAEGLAGMFRYLKAGYGVALNVQQSTNGYYAGGHSITLWGCVTDSTYPESDEAHYVSVFITDSDSDEQAGRDRRLAPDVLSLYHISPYEGRNFSLVGDYTYNSFCFYYSPRTVAVFNDYAYLVPYSADIPRETEAAATRDLVHSPDLTLSACVGTTDKNRDLLDTFETGATVWFMPIPKNTGKVAYNGVLDMDVVVTDADGRSVYTDNIRFSHTLNPDYSVTLSPYCELHNLAPGVYTMTFTVNADRSASEAYYYNNTYTHIIRVGDFYLLGDVDNDEEITVFDVTCIQRMLAELTPLFDMDDRAAVRADVSGDGIDIFDATQIQRHLARLAVYYPVGERQMYAV